MGYMHVRGFPSAIIALIELIVIHNTIAYFYNMIACSLVEARSAKRRRLGPPSLEPLPPSSALTHLCRILPPSVQRMFGLDQEDQVRHLMQALGHTHIDHLETLSHFLALPPRDPIGPWGFDRPIVRRFPALARRNFFVVQEHSVRSKSP